jgi:hypothetical protein
MKIRVLMAAALALAGAPLLRGDGPAPPPKEKKRPPAGKVYREEDLRRGGTVSIGVPAEEASPAPEASPAAEGTPGAQAAPAAGGAEATPAEPTEEELRAKRRAELQGRIDEEREKIRLFQQRVDEIQSELNDMSGPIYGLPGGNDRRTGLMNEIEEARRQIRQAQEAIESLEEQARREGMPVSRP